MNTPISTEGPVHGDHCLYCWQNPPENPVALLCGHSYCHECIDTLQRRPQGFKICQLFCENSVVPELLPQLTRYELARQAAQNGYAYPGPVMTRLSGDLWLGFSLAAIVWIYLATGNFTYRHPFTLGTLGYLTYRWRCASTPEALQQHYVTVITALAALQVLHTFISALQLAPLYPLMWGALRLRGTLFVSLLITTKDAFIQLFVSKLAMSLHRYHITKCLGAGINAAYGFIFRSGVHTVPVWELNPYE